MFIVCPNRDLLFQNYSNLAGTWLNVKKNIVKMLKVLFEISNCEVNHKIPTSKKFGVMAEFWLMTMSYSLNLAQTWYLGGK